jgi:hypothetical protein
MFEDRRQSTRIKSLLRHIHTTYYNVQAYFIDFNRELRKLAMNPTTQVQSDAVARLARQDALQRLRRKSVVMNVGDFSSAMLAVSFKDTKAKTPMQDMYLDGLNELLCVDQFVSNYQFINQWHQRFVMAYPAYREFQITTDFIDMAWKYTTVQHRAARAMMESYKLYHNRIFTTLRNFNVLPGIRYSGKLGVVFLGWTQALNSGLLGIQDSFILNPTSPRVDQRLNDQIYRYVDVWQEVPAPAGARNRYSFTEFIEAVNQGITDYPQLGAQVILGQIFEPNVIIEQIWVNVSVGERDTRSFDTVLDMSSQIPVVNVSVKSVWRDLRKHIELGLYDRKPTVGILKPPFITILRDEWTVTPWYRSARAFDGLWAAVVPRIRIRHPFTLVTKVERVSRS